MSAHKYSKLAAIPVGMTRSAVVECISLAIEGSPEYCDGLPFVDALMGGAPVTETLLRGMPYAEWRQASNRILGENKQFYRIIERVSTEALLMLDETGMTYHDLSAYHCQLAEREESGSEAEAIACAAKMEECEDHGEMCGNCGDFWQAMSGMDTDHEHPCSMESR